MFTGQEKKGRTGQAKKGRRGMKEEGLVEKICFNEGLSSDISRRKTVEI